MTTDSSAIVAAQARELASLLAAAQAEVASITVREAGHDAAVHAAGRALEDAQAQRRALVRHRTSLIDTCPARVLH